MATCIREGNLYKRHNFDKKTKICKACKMRQKDKKRGTSTNTKTTTLQDDEVRKETSSASA